MKIHFSTSNDTTSRRRHATGMIIMMSILMLMTVPGFFPIGSDSAGTARADSEVNLFEAGAFESPDRCLRCHRDIHEAWSGSKHRFAWEDSFYQPDYLKAGHETEGFTDVFCGECHAPIARRTGQLPPRDGSLFDDTARMGISCDYCHTVKEIIEPANVDTLSAPGKVKRGPKGDGRSPYHQVEYSEIHTQAAFCGACHNVVHPATGAVVIDTYNDWKEGPYAAAGVRCQDCHMTPGPGIEKNPGKSSPMGKERDHVATHFFPGGSVFFQELAGNEKQAEMARRLLEAAAEVETRASRGKDAIELIVRVSNVGAGHKIPTGVTYIRKMWLEITAWDKNGDVVFRSGHVGTSGQAGENRIDPETVFYRLLFRDADGNTTPKSWLAAGIAYDRRIPAGGHDEQSFTIPAAAADTGSCRILVRLLYRSMSQEAADHLGPEKRVVPSIEMARAEIQIP